MKKLKEWVWDFVKEEDAVGVVEIILILVVLIGLVIIFKEQITNLVNSLLSKIAKQRRCIFCMRKKGSVTVFLTLILSLLLSLICASIESVRMASARTQILNGMDIGLYSLFGQYDKELLTDYDLFALDGSRGGGQLDLAAVCDELEVYMNPVLKQNSQKLTLCQSGLTGYRLLTDQKGEAFYQQIVGYMQETLGSQGIQLLLGRQISLQIRHNQKGLLIDMIQR